MNDIMLTTEGCRFCLMCRHVCPVTRVTFNEATSPHGWALAVASVRRGLMRWDADTVDLLYQCADCGLCQAHCATDQPLPYAIVAARAEIVASGHAPAAVAEIDAALRRELSANGSARTKPAEVALFAGSAGEGSRSRSLAAARALLESSEIEHALVATGRDSAYLAYTLGLHDTARELARAAIDEVKRASCRTLITLSPEATHTLVNIYPLLGVPVPEGIAVIELADLLCGLLDEDRLRLRWDPDEWRGSALAYHDPCQTVRLDGRWRAPRRLLAALTGRPQQEGFWREKRATPCGASGGLPWTQPGLAAALARAALADATRGGARVVVTEAPSCLAHLRAHAGEEIEIKGLYELLAEHLG